MKVVMSVGSRNTACGHNDFCSVRLNGPIWWFILTHRYRLSLSQFTEAVMIGSAIGPLLLRKSKSLPTQKCHAPPAVAESSRLIDSVNPNNSAIFVENRSFQIVPKQKGAMNTQSRSHAYKKCINKLPHGSAPPERVLPYRHVDN